MSLKVARRGGISPFIVMDVMRAANARDLAAKTAAERCVHLEVGQPGTPAPRAVREAAAAALNSERLGYTLALGIEPLRERIARHYRDMYGVAVPPERIVVTTGSSGAFLLGIPCRIRPWRPRGARRSGLSRLSQHPDRARHRAGRRRRRSGHALPADAGPARSGRGDRSDGLIVASPANPTGSMMAPEDLEAVAGWCRARGVRLISDEIYHGITYGMRAATALAFSDEAIVINSFSKYFSMTGWRLGWMIVPPDLLRAVEVLAAEPVHLAADLAAARRPRRVRRG